MAKFRVLGIRFDHMHMGDLLREVQAHPDAEIAGVYDPDPAKMANVVSTLGIPADRVFTDLEACLAQGGDLAIVCSATGDHARTVAELAPHGLDVMVEKPFAASAADARAMIAAMEGTGHRLAINWPLAWYPVYNTVRRLIADGAIGRVIEVHSYGGNRGPLYHLADKVVVSEQEVERQKPGSWWYKKASGGGSQLDYLGYGTTLATWFRDGEAPVEMISMVDEVPGIEVDQHSITVARYTSGLSKFETRWGTISDPWTQQPLPKCGFHVVGTDGALSAYDYDDFVTLQTRADPTHRQVRADPLPPERQGAVAYMLSRIAGGLPVEGPLDPALCLTAQRMIDTAVRAAAEKRALPLVD